jgi:hypothetical protein
MERAVPEGSEVQDVEQTLEQIRSAVRREAGYLTEDDVPTGPQLSPVRDAADLASVSAHLPLQSALPVVGSLVVLVQRMLRLGLRWYINPIVEQQNAFNDSVAQALTELEMRQNELNRRLDSLQSTSRQEAE